MDTKKTIRIPKPVAAAFKRLAERDERSENFVYIKALAGYARQRGELTDAQD